MLNIIQWNCRGLKANLNDLLLLITNCTVKHILINCHYLRQIRSKHYKSDNLKDLFENNNPSKIINFIKEIGIVRKIKKKKKVY